MEKLHIVKILDENIGDNESGLEAEENVQEVDVYLGVDLDSVEQEG